MSTNVPNTALPPVRDVRLALVLNGGVSLAIWIGGVTHEIDAARRGLPPGAQDDGRDTAPLYDRLNSILGQQVVVDVIGGASAGGINGVMLGAAIYTGAELPNLREVWIELGDFRKLLRPATSSAPPSLLRGDELVLSELSRQLRMLFGGAVGPAPTEPLDLFFPATDIEGVPRVFQDSTGRRFAERDPRRVFHFTSSQTGTVPIVGGAVRTPVWLGDSAAPSLLAHAGRSSSSFPVAFEAHRVTWIDDDNPSERSLVDGGILDNQPFNPVLDAIGIHPASRPLRRVLLYVVPYVTEPDAPSGATATAAPVSTPALGTASAALNLPRELPKLQGLERVTRELLAREQLAALQLATRRSEIADSLAEAAGALFESYCRTRQAASAAVFRAWAQPGFRVGDGAVGQAPDLDAADVSVPGPPLATAAQPTAGYRWIPAELAWSGTEGLWEWGFSPAERVAAWILLTLADARFPEDQAALHTNARIQASRLISRARNGKRTLSEICHATAQGDPISRPASAYASPTIVSLLRRTQYDFRKLNQMVTDLNSTAQVGCGAATVQEALNFEVVRNAFGIQDLVIPPRFTFVMASAGVRNSLGHIANSPATKLAGMKLNHFGGFLKRSWRANDWLWGRLDGVEHLLNALIDADRIIEIGAPIAAAPLAELAFALEPGAPETPADHRELERAWADAVRGVTFPTNMTSPQAQFEEVLDRALSAEPGSPEAARLLRSCRRVIAARVQLRILSADLERVAEAAREDVQAGTSKIASGALWANRLGSQLDASKRVALFKDMHIGEETLSDETSSRYTADIVAQGAAVATSMLAGDRGGLPAAGRAMLGSVRNLTLAASFPIRLLAQQPLLGVAALVVLIGLLVGAFTSSSALLGASLPALALLTAIVGLAVLTSATSVFEESPTSASRWVGWALGFGTPFAFFLVALGTNEVAGIDVPGPDSTRLRVHAWFVERCGEGAVELAGVFSLVAAVLAIALLTRRLLGQRRGTRTAPWRAGLTLYRLTIIGALGSLIVGFIWTRATQHRADDLKGWAAIANEHQGAVLVVVLVAALVAAGLVVELVVPSLRKALRQP